MADEPAVAVVPVPSSAAAEMLVADVPHSDLLTKVKHIFAQYWLLLTVVAAFLVIAFMNRGSFVVSGRVIIVGLLAAALLTICGQYLLPGSDTPDAQAVRYVVAFDAVVFIVLGLVATLLACGEWQIGFLLAGSALLIGGFFGLLFGYPQGVAQQNARTATGSSTQSPGTGETVSDASSPLPPAPAKNLLAQAAATLGTALAGFTLAKTDQVGPGFATLCRTVGPALLSAPDGLQNSASGPTLAAVVMIYFLATGFFAGLLLPTYFMKDQF